MVRRRYRSSGFTLVELSIVVVIVGVLAVLAIVGYRRYRAAARMAEATNMSTGIRAAQEQHKAEVGIYANVSNNTASFYPAAAPGKFVTAWGGTCGNCPDINGWEKLRVKAEAPVMFGYATVAGVGGATVGGKYTPPPGANGATNGTTSSLAGIVKTVDPFFIAVAWGDSDADGVPCIVMSFSHSNHLVVQGEGE